MLTTTETTYLRCKDMKGFSRAYRRQIGWRIRQKVIETYGDLMLLEEHRDKWDTRKGILSDKGAASKECFLALLYSKRIKGKNVVEALIRELQEKLA